MSMIKLVSRLAGYRVSGLNRQMVRQAHHTSNHPERSRGTGKPANRLTGKGFTFVELLLVVIIFSILSLAVYATFASGMRMWARMKGAAFSQRVAILRLEKISSDLRQILNFPKIGFSGKINEISFPILSANDEILEVTYFLAQDNLLRKQERFKDILEEKEEEARAKTLLIGVEDLKFNFAYKEIDKEEYSWKDAWDKEEGLPIMVKIELKTKDADFAKTITIPIS